MVIVRQPLEPDRHEETNVAVENLFGLVKHAEAVMSIKEFCRNVAILQSFYKCAHSLAVRMLLSQSNFGTWEPTISSLSVCWLKHSLKFTRS